MILNWDAVRETLTQKTNFAVIGILLVAWATLMQSTQIAIVIQICSAAQNKHGKTIPKTLLIVIQANTAVLVILGAITKSTVHLAIQEMNVVKTKLVKITPTALVILISAVVVEYGLTTNIAIVIQKRIAV